MCETIMKQTILDMAVVTTAHNVLFVCTQSIPYKTMRQGKLLRLSVAPLNPLLSWTEAHTGVADTITSSGLGSGISTSNCTRTANFFFANSKQRGRKLTPSDCVPFSMTW